MEPRIQYAQTRDGASIAFWTAGQGPPLVYFGNLVWSHAQLEWRFPEMRSWFERLGEGRQLVRFDPRGTGLSQRVVDGYSLEALALDLEAVVNRLRLERFALFGEVNSGQAAISYAATHPEQVSHLIIWCGFACTADTKGPQMQALEALQTTMVKDWMTYTEARAHMGFGWSDGESAHRYAAFLRECTTPETAWRIYRAIDDFDVRPLLSQVTAPTLILHRRQFTFWDVDQARTLAAGIPNAQLTLVEGAEAAAYLGDTDAVLSAVSEFLGPQQAQPAAPPAGEVVTILFTDITSSTPLTQRLGDADFHELRRAHNEIVREALRACGGSEIKHTGDGIMASFTSAARALAAAIAVQRKVAERNDPNLQVHVALNAGEPIAEDSDLFGTAVDLASRIRDQARAGEILVSDVVRQLVAGKGYLFADRGDVALRGFEDPVRLYEVRWRAEESA
jgi:class 3 adenylate cyclase